jgi:hypothetical protein
VLRKQVRTYEIGGACNTYGKGGVCIQSLSEEKRVRIILKWMLKKQAECVYWIHQAQNGNQCQAVFANTAMNL